MRLGANSDQPAGRWPGLFLREFTGVDLRRDRVLFVSHDQIPTVVIVSASHRVLLLAGDS